MTKTSARKIEETRLRDVARRRGMALHRSRVRDPQALGYGLYRIADAETGAVIAGSGVGGYTMTLHEVTAYLADDTASEGAEAGIEPGAGAVGPSGPVDEEALAARVVRLEEALPQPLRLKAVAEILTHEGLELEGVLRAWEFRAWPTPQRRTALDEHLRAHGEAPAAG
ncbi:hypothetical protein ACIQVO_35945 [Streptomyces sp. NPDC101062]|uniref:hypothetical protein n=1 Tax=unclassified Streptomyces TaxID=2593676 RepID=UPI003815C33C